MSLWLFMADAGSHLLSQNLSLCFWFKVWCSLNMTFGKCHWTLAVFCWLLFYSLVALKVYVLSPLCAGLWVSNSLFVFLSLQVMSWQKAECQHHTSTYESDSRLLLLSVLYTFFAYFDSESNCAAFSLRCNKVWLDSFTLSCVRLANNDLLSLDPFSPTLAAGSSHSVSSSTGNTSFHLDSCGRVFLHDARFYISTVSLNKMCTTNKGSLWFLFKLVLLRFQSSVGLATLVFAGGNSKFKAAANMCRAATLSGIQQTNKWFICLECSQTNSHCFNEEVSQ